MVNQIKIFFLGFLGVLLIAFFFDFHKSWQMIRQSRQQKINLKLQIEENQRLFNRPVAAEAYKIFKMPADPIDLLFRLHTLAEWSGLQVKTLEPRQIKSDAGYYEQAFLCRLKGSLTSMNTFLFEMVHQQLPILFVRFKLHALKEDVWILEILLDAFLKKPLTERPLLPVIPPSPTQWLTLFPLNQIRYVGQMKSNKARWALLQLPNGKTLPVVVGAVVGVEKRRVIKIQDHKLFLTGLHNPEGRFS